MYRIVYIILPIAQLIVDRIGIGDRIVTQAPINDGRADSIIVIAAVLGVSWRMRASAAHLVFFGLTFFLVGQIQLLDIR